MATVLQLLFKRTFVKQATRWLVTIAILGGLGFAGFVAYTRYSVPEVLVTEVVVGPVVQAFYATGTLLPHREYPIKANVEGTLVEVLVDKGSEVTEGQKLARVQVDEFQLKRTQAEADLTLTKQLANPKTSPTLLEFDAKIRAAEKQLDVANHENDRLANLRQTKAGTITEIERAEEAARTAFNTLEALKSAKATRILELARELKTTQAQLDIANWNIDQQTITSPISGFVLDWPTATGTRVKVNDIIMNVADIRYDHLVMRTNVDEEDITRVLLDQVVHITLYAYRDRVFEARVKKIYPKADPARRTFEVDVRLIEPDKGFAAGMTGELAFVVDRKEKAVVVPSQAVQGGVVWVVRDGRLATVEVELGLRSIQRAEILAGLAPDDEVVISPIGKLTVGREVHTQHIDPDVAAGLNEPKAAAPNNFKGLK